MLTIQKGIIVSSLAELRTAFTSSDSDSEIPFSPRCTIPLPGQPNIICFASSDSRLVVGLLSGSIAVYDAMAAANPGANALQPLHVFNSPTGRPPHDISPNPGGIPDLVAALYQPAGSVELLDVQKLQVIGGWQSGGTPETTPTSSEIYSSICVALRLTACAQSAGPPEGSKLLLECRVAKLSHSRPTIPPQQRR